ncbi:MAG: tail fiber protein [Pseudomonadota bacterium]
MAEQLLMPLARDNSGNAQSGWTAEFQEPGTTTPKTVYTDANITTAITTPYTSDADGAWPNPFVASGDRVKLVIKDADGVEQSHFSQAYMVSVSTGDSGASGISFTATGQIADTNVQDAVETAATLVSVSSDDSTPRGLLAKLNNTDGTITIAEENGGGDENVLLGTTGLATTAQNTAAGKTVTVSSNDTTPGVLNGKLVAGTGVTLTEGSDGGNETLTIAATAAADAGETVTVSGNDTTPGHLKGKLVAGTGVTLTEGNNGGDETLTVAIDSAAVPGIEALPIIGEIRPKAGTTVPSRWVECNGQALTRTTYSDLFAEIGITWGTGDGITTFNVPDLRDYFLRGAGTGNPVGTVEADQIANHVHTQETWGGASSGNGPSLVTDAAGGTTTTSNPTSGAGDETRPQNKRVQFIIYHGVA